jgi:predicted nucleotidyltransferase component of viral defense system
MKSLIEILKTYIDAGYEEEYAKSKICQDIIIHRISNSRFRSNITVKGGVVMFHLTNSIRRATVDLDIDFIKLSIQDDELIETIEEIASSHTDDFTVLVNKDSIEELKQSDYFGKRIFMTISDTLGNQYMMKLDIGVHSIPSMAQGKMDLNSKIFKDEVSFLANSKEQMFVEKTIPLLRFGQFSTRYKDIFDMYWLIKEGELDQGLLMTYFEEVVFGKHRVDDIRGISSRVRLVFNDKFFVRNLGKASNWTDVDIHNITKVIMDYLDSLSE